MIDFGSQPVQSHLWFISTNDSRSQNMGEGRFLLEGEEIFCCSRVGIRKQLPSPKVIPSNVLVDDKVVVFLV